MTRNTYNLINEPSGNQYRDLLDFASNYCDTFQLVVRDSVEVSDSAKAVLENLEPFVVSKSRESEWFATKLLDETATVFRFTFSNETIQLLKDVSTTLYSWIQPTLPEDPSLIRPDGEPFLVTIAHEKDGYLILSADEKGTLDVEIPSIRVSE